MKHCQISFWALSVCKRMTFHFWQIQTFFPAWIIWFLSLTLTLQVSVPIVSNDRCKSMFLKAGRHEFIPEIFLCAGHEKGWVSEIIPLKSGFWCWLCLVSGNPTVVRFVHFERFRELPLKLIFDFIFRCAGRLWRTTTGKLSNRYRSHIIACCIR